MQSSPTPAGRHVISHVTLEKEQRKERKKASMRVEHTVADHGVVDGNALGVLDVDAVGVSAHEEPHQLHHQHKRHNF